MTSKPNPESGERQQEYQLDKLVLYRPVLIREDILSVLSHRASKYYDDTRTAMIDSTKVCRECWQQDDSAWVDPDEEQGNFTGPVPTLCQNCYEKAQLP